jgi:hypothetical protein
MSRGRHCRRSLNKQKNVPATVTVAQVLMKGAD